MTAYDSANRQPTAAKATVLPDAFDGIFRACGLESTAISEERSQKHLIQPYEEQDHFFHLVFQLSFPNSSERVW